MKNLNPLRFQIISELLFPHTKKQISNRQRNSIKKYPKSVLKGSANVLIYPNLDAGNIAYKVTERIAGYEAIGPLLQGFNKPIHDLSRGCSVQDIVKVSMIGAYQGINNANI